MHFRDFRLAQNEFLAASLAATRQRASAERRVFLVECQQLTAQLQTLVFALREAEAQREVGLFRKKRKKERADEREETARLFLKKSIHLSASFQKREEWIAELEARLEKDGACEERGEKVIQRARLGFRVRRERLQSLVWRERKRLTNFC